MKLAAGLVATGVVFLAVSVSAESKEPTGLGDVKFQTPEAEVLKAFPKLEKLDQTTSLGEPVVGDEHVSRYVLKKYEMPGLAKPVDVEVRFWDGKFWFYVVYLGDNDAEAALAQLTKEYGENTGGDPRFPLWTKDKTTIMLQKKLGRYSVADNALSKEAQNWFIETVQKRRGAANVDVVDMRAKSPGATPAQSASPAVTPAATTKP